jgi:hypothetical protein
MEKDKVIRKPFPKKLLWKLSAPPYSKQIISIGKEAQPLNTRRYLPRLLVGHDP